MYNPLDGIDIVIKEKSAGDMTESMPMFAKGWSKDIVDSNLFSPARSYIQPKQSLLQIKQVEPPRRPELNLKGIALDQSGEYIAYIEKDKAKAIPLRKGDKLDDVEVVEVRQKSVDLKWNEEAISLSLEKIKTIKRPR